MKPQLKPLSEQTLVITGATSGHGLATARKAAGEGAKVILVARDDDALRLVRDDLRAQGGVAEYVVADVGDKAAIQAVADFAVDRFGGFDTWINNAGIGVYGEALDVPTEDHEKVFQTNYWGVVHGSLAAIRHLKDRPGGGALINVGSVNSDMASGLLSAYNASKHAVKGFTDSLRIEMMQQDAPVSITLIKPSAIGTPFPEHGRNITGSKAVLPKPIYSPELVADAILFAARTPRRAITVGASGRFQVFGATVFPSLFDQLASRMMGTLVDKDRPVGRVEGNLYEPQGDDGRAEGEQKGRGFSLYTASRIRPGATSAVAIVATGAALAALLALKPGLRRRLTQSGRSLVKASQRLERRALPHIDLRPSLVSRTRRQLGA